MVERDDDRGKGAFACYTAPMSEGMLALYIKGSDHSLAGLIFRRNKGVIFQCQTPKCVKEGCNIKPKDVHILFGQTYETLVNFPDLLSTCLQYDFLN